MAGNSNRTGRGRKFVLAAALLAVLGMGAALTVPSLRWRLHVVLLQVSGELPGVTLRELLALIHPSSGQDNLARMIDTRNPYAAIRNPHTLPSDVEAGAASYRTRCAVCHAPDGSGNGSATALAEAPLQRGASDWGIYKTIQTGVPGTAMLPHALSSQQLWQLVAYIRVMRAAREPVSEGVSRQIAVTLPYEELRSIQSPATEWLTYSGSYSSIRHSELTLVDPSNVSGLAVRWIHQFDGVPTRIEASPIVRNGVMFITLESGQVLALDARTGETIWTFERQLPEGIVGGEAGSTVNRGVALLGDKIYIGTWDARVLALSAATGKLEWEAKVADHSVYYISAAPLAYRDLIVTGVGNMGGGRGVIVAYDAATGAERWRFTAIPSPGEFGNDTWAGDSWQQGGAPTWMTGSYDVERDILYWGVGNPKPDYDPHLRAGDNLYSNSMVALRGSTGELLWHFQFTPADDKDWDSNQVPVLATLDSGRGPEPSLLLANRNGFYYVLERVTGEFRGATPFVHQTWTDGIDAAGRPRAIPKSSWNASGTLIYPGNNGATNWWSPSFDPELQLMYVPVLERAMVFYPSASSTPTASGGSFYTAVRALNAVTGELVWERRHTPRVSNPVTGGVMTTRSKLLFGGDADQFFALDSRTGELLWTIRTGGKICAAPITYTVDGEQYVSVAAGGDLLTFALPRANALEKSN